MSLYSSKMSAVLRRYSANSNPPSISWIVRRRRAVSLLAWILSMLSEEKVDIHNNLAKSFWRSGKMRILDRSFFLICSSIYKISQVSTSILSENFGPSDGCAEGVGGTVLIEADREPFFARGLAGAVFLGAGARIKDSPGDFFGVDFGRGGGCFVGVPVVGLGRYWKKDISLILSTGMFFCGVCGQTLWDLSTPLVDKDTVRGLRYRDEIRYALFLSRCSEFSHPDCWGFAQVHPAGRPSAVHPFLEMHTLFSPTVIPRRER